MINEQRPANIARAAVKESERTDPQTSGATTALIAAPEVEIKL